MASDETTQSGLSGANAQSTGDGRSLARDDRRAGAGAAGTSGAILGTSGERSTFLRALLFVAVVSLIVVAINSLTVIDDNPELDVWEPWVWEGSSALTIIAILWLPWMAYRRARPDGDLLKARFWLTHAAGLLAFSAAHVLGFLAIRKLVYAAVGGDYDFGPLTREFPYELRKDLLSYAVFIATFWIVERFGAAPEARAEPATFDILDGQRVIRVPLDRIVAITSAGNYVEFLLDDGRKPLMRAALTSVEGNLGERGFVRTHRSWLVNTTRVTGLKPEGSGDWSVELGEVEAPLSRRFRPALERLRGKP